MSDLAQHVELLSVARARTDLNSPEKRPIVVLSIRPHPDKSWAYHHLSLSIAQAERLRDDLINLLKAPAAFLLIAVLTLATGCSARVEVSNERSAAIEADSAAAPPATLEKHRTAVEINVFGKQKSEPAASPLADEKPSPAEAEGEPDERGDVTLIVVKEVHKHKHYHLPNPVVRSRWMSHCDEAERVRRIHEMKIRQYGVR